MNGCCSYFCSFLEHNSPKGSRNKNKQTNVAMSQLLVSFACILLSLASEVQGLKRECQENSTYVNIAQGKTVCFSLLLQEGLIDRDYAYQECRRRYQWGSLPTPLARVGYQLKFVLFCASK